MLNRPPALPLVHHELMATRFGITVDCADPPRLAAFWRRLLAYTDDPAPPGYDTWADYDGAHGVTVEQASAGATIVDPLDVGPRIYFQRVPESKTVKNRVHLDVRAGSAEERAQSRREVEKAGGSFLRASDNPADPFLVMADPEGNEFCLT